MLLNNVFYDLFLFSADDAGGEGQEPEAEPADETKPFKTFETEEDFKKVIQSESSKAQYKLLQELGVDKLDDVKAWKASNEELATVKADKEAKDAKIAELSTELTFTKLGVKDEFRSDLLALAKASVNEDTDFETATKAVVERHPHMIAAKKQSIVMGGDRGTGKPDGEGTSEALRRKYPFLSR